MMNQSIVRHYLEPTKRAPRIYSEENQENWLECLMRIIDVGDTIPVVGSTASEKLSKTLWGGKGKVRQRCKKLATTSMNVCSLKMFLFSRKDATRVYSCATSGSGASHWPRTSNQRPAVSSWVSALW